MECYTLISLEGNHHHHDPWNQARVASWRLSHEFFLSSHQEEEKSLKKVKSYYNGFIIELNEIFTAPWWSHLKENEDGTVSHILFIHCWRTFGALRIRRRQAILWAFILVFCFFFRGFNASKGYMKKKIEALRLSCCDKTQDSWAHEALKNSLSWRDGDLSLTYYYCCCCCYIFFLHVLSWMWFTCVAKRTRWRRKNCGGSLFLCFQLSVYIKWNESSSCSVSHTHSQFDSRSYF